MTDDQGAVGLDQLKVELAFGVGASLIGVYLGSSYELGGAWLWATDACQDPAQVCGTIPLGPLLIVLAVVVTIGVIKR